MFILWTSLLLATYALAQEVTESVEESPLPQNTTTLLPLPKAVLKKKESSEIARDTTTWKIETSYGESKLIEDKDNEDKISENINSSEAKNKSAEFRPSPQISNFIEENSFVSPTTESQGSFTPVIRKPQSVFKSKFPKTFFKSENRFPYSFEKSIINKAKPPWKPATMDSKPTNQAPVAVPAGGTYRLQDPFVEQPTDSNGEEFGLDFNKDLKDTALKKRSNPWEHLLHLLTTFIPVGLIISALTPNIVTVQTVDNDFKPFGSPPRLFKRWDQTPISSGAHLSERCRRRLLCELQQKSINPQRGGTTKPCYRYKCEDLNAVSNTLSFLLRAKPHLVQ